MSTTTFVCLALTTMGILSNSFLNASTIYVGPNGNGPVQLYGTNGDLTGTYGPSGATAAALDGLGDTYIAVPDFFGNSTAIYQYGSDPNTPLGQYLFEGKDSSQSDGYIDDLTYGGSGTLWLAANNGAVYHLDFSLGSILSSFQTGATFPGVATDGTLLYTTTGFGNGIIDTFDFSGNAGPAIITGLTDSFGIGYDTSSGTFWVGSDGAVSQVELNGNIVGSFAIPAGTLASGIEVDAAPASSASEVSTAGLYCLGLMALGMMSLLNRYRQTTGMADRRSGCRTLILLLSAVCPAFSTPTVTSLTPSLSSPRPVGTAETWTAAASDGANPLWYRFSVSAPGGSVSIFRDYQSANSFQWRPTQFDGGYQIQVTVKNQNDQTTTSFTVPFTVTPLVTTEPLVTATPNTLVALYSAPACPAGSSMRVRFWKEGETLYRATPVRACNVASSMNFYIAGMLGSTTYQIQHDLIRGPQITSGPLLSFTTGIPGISVSTAVLAPGQSPTSQTQGLLLFSGLPGVPNAALDLNGNMLWYYSTDGAYITRPEAGGNMLLLLQTVQSGSLTQQQNSERELLREIDVAGNTIMEINAARISELLGYPVNYIHHEGRRLPNGNLLFLTSTERIADQGAGPVDVIGDVIVVLDQNLNLVWSWNAFDHLNVGRSAPNHEICAANQGGCPPLYLASVANDWLHGNSVSPTSDGKYLLYSARHQDWVFKIDYNNGAGGGGLIWTLGFQGDFALANGDNSGWFSHQHDAEYELNGQQTLSLFDNGNNRQQPAATANSRGQLYLLNETARTATLQLNADLGANSGALGSAQRLSNGNYEFDLGFVNPAQFVEVNPAGAVVSKMQANQQSYRCFRMQDLYTP